MNKFFKYLSVVVAASVLFLSCKKNNLVIDKDVTPPTFVKFNTILPGDTIASYYITDNSAPVILPIGVTTVSNQDRVVPITYTSATAVQGQQFDAPNSVTIKAGEATTTLAIQGLASGYPVSTKIDTLTITVGGGDMPTSAYRSKYKLILRKYCEVTIDDFIGIYDNTREDWGGSTYGPYTTAVSSITPISDTKATIVVENIYNFGWGPITFELDWADPANFTVTPVPQSSGIADAGTIDSDYSGYEVQVRAFSGQPGTFSSCEGTITLRMQLGVAGLGWFSDLYEVVLAR